MRADQPGVGYLTCGAMLVALGAMSLTRPPPGGGNGPGWVAFHCGVGLIGALLGARGWSQFRRALRDNPGQAWPYLQDWAPLATALALMVSAALLPESAREGLDRTLHELQATLHELHTALHNARGGP